MHHRPTIGITTAHDAEHNRQCLSLAYVRAIEAAGGVPLILPMPASLDGASQLAALLDGLVIVGGPGIMDRLIGDLPDGLSPVSALRDRTDRWIYQRARRKGCPMLGICYGMQFINQMCGGSIYADVERALGVGAHTPDRGRNRHRVRIEPGTRLRAILGVEALEVNSYHYQAVAEVGAGLRASACSEDGVIEAIESEDGMLLGVQWHPELMPSTPCARLFTDFVSRCAEG